MFNWINMFKSPKKPTAVDVGFVRLTVEINDGRTLNFDVEGDAIQTGNGLMEMDASYISKEIIKRFNREGIISTFEAIPHHQISKILISERKQLMKEYE